MERTRMNMEADWAHKYTCMSVAMLVCLPVESFHMDRYSPLFADYRDKGGAWATILVLLFKQ